MNEEVYNADKELAISGKHGTDPQRNPAPRAALFSLFTDTDASFSVRRSTAAFRASKSAPLMGNMPAHHITAQRIVACCSSWLEIAVFRSRITSCDPMQDNVIHE